MKFKTAKDADPKHDSKWCHTDEERNAFKLLKLFW